MTEKRIEESVGKFAKATSRVMERGQRRGKEQGPAVNLMEKLGLGR